MTTSDDRRAHQRKLAREGFLKAMEINAHIASDETLPKRTRLRAAHQMVRYGWGPLTWRDWLRSPVASFIHWRYSR